MKRTALLALILFALLTRASPSIEPGQRAPSLAKVTWINGQPVDPAKPDGKTTYVVEFWATWCAPCKVTVPHLNKLLQDNEGRNVVIVGISDESEAKVRPFMERMKMQYRIAVDTNRTVINSYMMGSEGIPHAFIVDTNGLVVWSGHPLDRLDAVLKSVLDGTFDPRKIAALKEKEKALRQALQSGDVADALPKINELIAMDPQNMNYYQIKLGFVAQSKDFGRMKEVYADMAAAFADSAADLNTIAWTVVNAPFPMSDLSLAWNAARRAVELTGRKDGAVLDTLARVYYALCLLDQAVATETEALAKAKDEEREGMQMTLDHYKAAAALRTQVVQEAGAENKP